MNKRFVVEDITVLHGDCVRALKVVKPGCCIVTDPPFTMMTIGDVESMMRTLDYQASDVLVLTNPLTGYIHRGVVHQFTDGLATSSTEWHRHQRPLDAVTQLVALTQGVVVDPYCGSGTTLLAAHSLGRASVGIELDYDTFLRCCRRIEKSTGYGGRFL